MFNLLFALCLPQFIVSIAVPIALHQLVVVDSGKGAVVRLKGWDMNNPNLVYTITQVPASGTLNQLSYVYSNYGIDPKAGSEIDASTNVTGSNNRVYYQRPIPDSSTDSDWDTVQFTVFNGGWVSNPATVTFVAPNGLLESSSFLLNNEQWTMNNFVPLRRERIVHSSSFIMHSYVQPHCSSH